MKQFKRGEVWWVDLGLAGKVRPALILSNPPLDHEKALVSFVSHTTTLRGTQYEIAVRAPFLRPGAFDCQTIASQPLPVLIRIAGRLPLAELRRVESGVLLWLGLGPGLGESAG